MDAQQALGAGYTFEWRDRYWKLGSFNQNVKAALTAKVKLRIYDSAEADREAIGEKNYARRMERIDADMEAGNYNWGTPKLFEALFKGHTGHAATIEALLLEGNGREISPSHVKDMLADPEILPRLYMLMFKGWIDFFHKEFPNDKTVQATLQDFEAKVQELEKKIQAVEAK